MERSRPSSHRRRDRIRRPATRHRPALRVRTLLVSAVLACAALVASQVVEPAAYAVPGGSFAQLMSRFTGAGRPALRPGPPATTTPGAPGATAPGNPAAAVPAAPILGGDPNPNCTLVIPRTPLTAAGLATPYRLRATDPAAGPCHEANSAQSAFVEAAILDPATGNVSIYHPLVVDDGSRPAVAPLAPALPRGAVVGVWFGFQASVLTLRAHHLRRGRLRVDFSGTPGCINGAAGRPFGQFAYCGAPAFFAAANAAIGAGKLAVPDIGTGKDGMPCPTTRDFAVVDQDQSDNLPGRYLATADGRTAQFSAANAAALPGAVALTNASDNGLVDNKLDPILGCSPWTAPDLSQAGAPSGALALNELQAAAHQAAPVALVPPNDPMVTGANGGTDVAKTNLYRAGVNMPPVNPATDTGVAYCTTMEQVAPSRLTVDGPLTEAAPSPDPAVASSLFGFLVDRLTQSWSNLACDKLTGRPAPTVAGAAPLNTGAAPAAPTAPVVPAAPAPALAPAPTAGQATGTPPGTAGASTSAPATTTARALDALAPGPVVPRATPGNGR